MGGIARGVVTVCYGGDQHGPDSSITSYWTNPRTAVASLGGSAVMRWPFSIINKHYGLFHSLYSACHGNGSNNVTSNGLALIRLTILLRAFKCDLCKSTWSDDLVIGKVR